MIVSSRVRRFRLRYRSTDLELPLGEFIVGRSSECHLALDDARVSRRHARFHVEPASVHVDDLGSRNGVHVNGHRIQEPTRLDHLARVGIGDQLLTLVVLDEDPHRTLELAVVHCVRCGAPNARGAERCERCREPLPGSRRHLAQTVELPRPVGETETPRSTPQSSFDVVRGLAEKAFALGKRDDAERLLRPQLESLLALAQSEGELDDALFSAAAQAALRLVDQGPATRWIDWLFAFHESASRLMSLEIIDGLYEKARKVGYADPRPAHAYVASLAAAARDYGPAERFRLKRIEGLVRVLRG